jgi:hypothetical protein
MKLSDFIRYRNQLEAASVYTAETAADGEIRKIIELVKECPLPFVEHLTALENCHKEMHEFYAQFEDKFRKLKWKINEVILEQSHPWLLESEKRYKFEQQHVPIEAFLTKKTAIPDEDLEYFANRLGAYASWKHPGLMLRPGHCSLIHSMVNFDPLYIVDIHQDLLWPCQINFPDQYKRRLRPMVIDEESPESLSMLPDNQFGIVLAYDYFNFLPINIVFSLIEQIFKKLKPGGTLCFTFNDCDTEKGMKLVEMFYSSYITQRELIWRARIYGYTVAHTYNNDSPLTWIELRKPGELTSIRGGQTLARVNPKI